MSAGPQISWDAQPQGAPQVQWDEEQPKPKPQAPTGKDWLKSFFWTPKLSRTLGQTADWAEAKRNEAEERDLREASRTGKNPNPAGASSGAGWDALMRVARKASGATSPSSLGWGVGLTVAPEVAGPVLAYQGGKAAVEAGPRALQGDPEAVDAALTGLSTAAGGVTAARAGVAEAGGLRNTNTARLMKAGGRAIGDIATGTPPTFRVPEAPKALTQATQPGVNIPRAQESIPIAGARIQQLRQSGQLRDLDGNPITDIRGTESLLGGIRSGKQHVLAAIKQRTGPVADIQVDTSTVADAMERSIPKWLERKNPAQAARLREQAQLYRGTMSIDEIEKTISGDVENGAPGLNDELRNFYKRQSPTDSNISPETAQMQVEVQRLRKILDEKVEALGGEGVKDLKREYGALRDLERATAKQHAIATRTKEGGLWEGLSYLHAAGDLLSGDVLGAGRAGLALSVGKMLRTLRDPNFLIEQSFHGPKAFRGAEAIRPSAGPPTPRGLLPEPKPPLQGEIVEEPENIPPYRPSAAYQPPQLTEFAGREPSAPPPATRTAETTLPPDETRLGPTGQGGIRIPVRGMLPAAREAMGTPQPPAPKPKYTPSEKAEILSAPAKNYGPEFNAQEAQEEINRNRAILADPKATAEERSIAEGNLREARAASKEIAPTFNALKAAKQAIEKEAEPAEVKIKGITAEEPKPKREVAPPIEKRFSREEIEDAEGLISQEVGMMQAADRPGRYFDESEAGDVRTGSRQIRGGDWRGVPSLREHLPFLKEHPEWNPAQLEKALRNKDSAFYKRAMEAAIKFVNRGKEAEAEERAAIQEEAPEEREPEGVLPGFGQAVKEQEAGAGKVRAEELTRELNTPRSIEGAAGEMETKSPLFRGTEASPQREIFGEPAANPRRITKEDVDAKPWEYSADRYQTAHGVHQPWIGEISPMQMSRMSKRAKAQYEAKRHGEWDASLNIKKEWQQKLIDAYERGTIDHDTPGLSPEAKSQLTHYDIESEKQAKTEALNKALKENEIKSVADVKAGDKVYSLIYGRYATVLRTFTKGVRLKDSTGYEWTADARTLQRQHYNDVKAAVENP